MMDSISRPEFAKIFYRISMDIDLAGCSTALAIEIRLEEARDLCTAKSKISKTQTKKTEYGRKAEWFDTLIENDFAGRSVFEARINPNGPIAITLKYGRQEARRILAQRKAALRSRLASRPVIRAPAVPAIRKVPELPQFKRKPTHRRLRRFRGEYDEN